MHTVSLPRCTFSPRVYAHGLGLCVSFAAAVGCVRFVRHVPPGLYHTSPAPISRAHPTEQRTHAVHPQPRGHSHSSSGCMSPTKLRAHLCAIPAALAAAGDLLALPCIAAHRLSLLSLVACVQRLLVLLQVLLLLLCPPVPLQCLVDPLHRVVQLCFGGLHLLLGAVTSSILLQVATERSEGPVAGCLRMSTHRRWCFRQKAC